MKHKISISFSLIFVLWLLLPHISPIFKFKAQDKYFQNRYLYSLPKIEIASILSSSFGKDMDKYIWDHLLFRAFFLEVDHWIDYHVFNDSPLPELITIGKDGWLFYYPAITTHPKINLEQVGRFAESVRLAGILEKQLGLDILFLVSPIKPSIYPEFISDAGLKYFNLYFPKFQRRLEDIASDTDDILLLWDSFRMERDRLFRQNDLDSENTGKSRYLFSPKGEHYDWDLSIFQAKCIVEKLAPGKWRDNLYDDYLTPYRLEQSEMAKLLNIYLPEPARSFNSDKFFKSFAINVVKGESEGLHIYTTGKNPYIDPVPLRIMFIHDSFMQKSYPFLLPYFKESIFINWSSIDKLFTPALNEIRSVDILVIQRIDESWFNRYDILERILKELDPRSTE